MEELSVSNTNTPINVRELLQKYDNMEFSELQYKGYKLENVPDDFTGQRIKNGDYEECSFNGNSFKYVGAAGTRFRACTFTGCVIQGANMQFCDFSNSRIQSNKNTKTMLDASNLNQSCFYKTELHDLLVENTSISQSQFFQTKIY